MGSCYAHIEKLKGNEVAKAWKHNTRQPDDEDKERYDKTLSHLNKEIVPLKEDSYMSAVDKEIEIIKANKTMPRGLRRDAVKGFEVVFNFPDDMDGKIDVDAWAEANKQFLFKEFGESNVKHMILHLDEPHRDEEDIVNNSNAHIHAFITPVTKDGRLCAKAFFDGKADINNFQQRYYNQVGKAFGFKKPLEHSPRKSADIGKFYAVIADCQYVDEKEKLKILEAVVPKDGESLKVYHKRVEKEIVDIYEKAVVNVKIAARKEVSLAQNKSMHSSNIYYNKVRELAAKDEARDEEIEKLLTTLRSSGKSIKELRNSIKNIEYLQAGLEELAKTDRIRAEEMQKMLREVTELGRKAKKEKEKEYKDIEKNMMQR